MKTIILSLVLIILISGCKKAECGFSSGIEGGWKLVEELIGPGDGSGTFQPVSSDKKIKFCDDGTFESNGETCTMTGQSGTSSQGTYNTSGQSVSPEGCPSTSPYGISYSLNGNTLILSYPCFEGCQQKYYRI